MFISVWVFFVLGDSLVAGEPPAYEQVVVSDYIHRVRPDIAEEVCAESFHEKHQHHVVCDSGWRRQQIEVNKA